MRRSLAVLRNEKEPGGLGNEKEPGDFKK